jgi:threonine dehydratase
MNAKEKSAVDYLPEIAAIRKAAETLKGVSADTPLMENINLSRHFESRILLKREDLQPVRSYKIRGAYNKMASLRKDELKNGIVCASAGNHAQGVAYSCQKLKVKGTIFMPSPTPKQKVGQVSMFGEEYAEIVLTGDTFDDAKAAAMDYCHKHQKVFIHPFEDPKVIEGQGTVGLELLEQTKEPLDYVFMPVGGGGLASGVSSVLKLLSPHTKLIGVEPKGAPSLKTSLKNGYNTKLEKIEKFVDGAAVQQIGDLNFSICQQLLDDVVTVHEGKICETILSLYNKDAIVVEPAGALSISALDQFKEEIKGKNVACIVSGSNNDITRTEEIRERALLYAGLKHYFIVNFPQRAGALKEFVVEVLGPNDDITHFEYTKKNSREKGSAVVGVELKDPRDFDLLLDKMKARNFFGEYINKKSHLLDILV